MYLYLRVCVCAHMLWQHANGFAALDRLLHPFFLLAILWLELIANKICLFMIAAAEIHSYLVYWIKEHV